MDFIDFCYMAVHATLTARDFFLTNFYPSVHSSAFFKNLSRVSVCVGCGSHCFLYAPTEQVALFIVTDN